MFAKARTAFRFFCTKKAKVWGRVASSPFDAILEWGREKPDCPWNRDAIME